MGRRGKAKFHTDGVLVVNKPEGPTSHDVVARLRGRFRPAKLGHTGTLDPFSSGVLVLAFNRATKLAGLLGAGGKLYRAGLALGAATDTGDLTGEVVERSEVPKLQEPQVRQALDSLLGQRMQAPPAYSAAKHQGRPLYAYARQGVSVKKPPRPITVHRAELLALGDEGFSFELACSRGTYVRSLGEELAVSLGTVGHLKSLVRLESAPFALDEAVSLDQALSLSSRELAEALISPVQALSRCGLPAATLDDELVWQLRQGRILGREVFLSQVGQGASGSGSFMALSPEGELAAVLRWLGPGGMRPGRDYETIKVFPEQSDSNNPKQALSTACEAE